MKLFSKFSSRALKCITLTSKLNVMHEITQNMYLFANDEYDIRSSKFCRYIIDMILALLIAINLLQAAPIK